MCKIDLVAVDAEVYVDKQEQRKDSTTFSKIAKVNKPSTEVWRVTCLLVPTFDRVRVCSRQVALCGCPCLLVPRLALLCFVHMFACDARNLCPCSLAVVPNADVACPPPPHTPRAIPGDC
eukprot:14372177-Alexandrium_andersonii.AAC.1